MKLNKPIVAILTALLVGGCYWVPPKSESGGVALSISAPRGVLPGYEGHSIRAYLYNEDGVRAEYWDGGQFNPAPLSTYDTIAVTISGSPIPVDGNDYYEVGLGNPNNQGNAGSFTLPDIAVGKRYRLYLEWAYRVPQGSDYDYWYGVSRAFEVNPGEVVDVAVDLYSPYIAY